MKPARQLSATVALLEQPAMAVTNTRRLNAHNVWKIAFVNGEQLWLSAADYGSNGGWTRGGIDNAVIVFSDDVARSIPLGEYDSRGWEAVTTVESQPSSP